MKRTLCILACLCALLAVFLFRPVEAQAAIWGDIPENFDIDYIDIATYPDKMDYTAGETLDLTGGVIRVDVWFLDGKNEEYYDESYYVDMTECETDCTTINDCGFFDVVLTYRGKETRLEFWVDCAYSDEYRWDGIYHWQVCDYCEDPSREQYHSYDNGCDTTCNICGKERSAQHTYDNDCDTDCNECGAERSTRHIYTNACDTTCNECGAERTTKHTYTNSCDTSCNTCGYTRTIKHTYDNSCDTACNVCGAKRTIKHTYDNDCDKACNVCGVTRTIKHTYSNACDTICNICKATRTIKHTYSNDCDKTCNECGAKRSITHTYDNTCDKSCNVCSATRTIKHTYDNDCDKACNVCGAKRSTKHVYDNDCDTICNICKATRTIKHTYDNDCDTTCNVCKETRTVGDHKYSNTCDTICNECGATRTIKHTYDNACDKSCNVCSVTRSTKHTYDNACDKACNVCGAKRSTKHVYDNDCDTICNICKATRTIKHTYSNDCDKTCNVCKAKRTVGDHKYSNTCDKTCNECGAKRSIEHTYTNDCDKSCNVCGAKRSIKHAYDNACDKSCNVCGAKRSTKHTYSNKCDTTCNVCKATRTIKHTYSNKCDTTCNVCKAKRTIKHTYSNDCDKTCNVCKAKRTVGDHKYSNTCDKTCNECGAKRSIKHTYTNNCDKSCNVCGAKRSTTHKYKNEIKRATLTTNGTITKKCTICGYKASTTKISYPKTFKLSATSYRYNGKVQTPSVTVKNSAGKTLKEGTDYTVTYSTGRKNVGTYKVTIKMKGNYSGTKTLTYKITPISIQACYVSLSKTDFSYNGKVQTPSLEPIEDLYGTKLKKGTDYTVTYSSGRKNVGIHKVTIKMKGNYSGTKTLTYVIKPTLTTSTSMYAGSTYKIGAKSNTTIKYTSSNKSVATVNSKGVITAQKAGTATITITSGKISQKITVTVIKPTISIYSAYDNYGEGDFFEVGDTMQFYASVTGSNAKVKWSVSNTSIATISSSGLLKGKKIGTVTVTGSITCGSQTYKSSCTVEVSASFPDVSIYTYHDTDYTCFYNFAITNYGDAPLKIVARGNVYCDGYSESISYLCIDSGGYIYSTSSYTLEAGESLETYVGLTNSMRFWSSETSWMDLYVEYKGELFRLECSTSKDGYNKLYMRVWIIN